MINPALYSEYYWLRLENYDDESWESFKHHLGQFPKAFSWDGFDDENREICFRFGSHIPENENDIKKCKKKNALIKKEVLNIIERNLHGRVYFNKAKGFLKNLEKE